MTRLALAVLLLALLGGCYANSVPVMPSRPLIKPCVSMACKLAAYWRPI